ncbi:MAG: COQ9 family protein [Alphaproteobacteria bacterium]
MQAATERDEALDARRRALLAAALAHVPFDGWSPATLAAGARDAGLDEGEALRAVPGGPVEAFGVWSTDADRAMVEALEAMDLGAMRTRDRIAAAIRHRLAAVAPHREALRRALGVLAMPHNAPRAADLTWRTVDAIWRVAGDRSTDWNFYSKRGLLAGVYGATLLRFLEDRSEGSAESWAFLDRRIEDVMRVPRALSGLRDRLACLPGPLSFLRGREAGRR